MKNNVWHKDMYDTYYADSTLNSKTLRDKAKLETDFILSKTNIKTNSRILDVPCGTGRHSYGLAKRGFRVTGIDISDACLKIARTEWNHKNTEYLYGNMNDLSAFKRYDLTLNLFSSFGYFATDKQNQQVLKQLYNSLLPNGQLVLNAINRNWLLTIYSSNDWHEHKGNYILNRRSYDEKTHYNEAWMTVINRKTLAENSYFHRCRLYSKNEMVTMLKKTGFKKVIVYGDYEGCKFKETESTHPYYFATK